MTALDPTEQESGEHEDPLGTAADGRGHPSAPSPSGTSEPEVTVHDNPIRHRFEVFMGDALAGSSADVDLEDGDSMQRIFHHTVVGEEHAGQGLAGTLTRIALAETVASGRRIVAVCPDVVRWLWTHHELDASIDPVGPRHLAALR